ncbi:MAG: aminopeptidase [Cellulosilyticaceae bacterium]
MEFKDKLRQYAKLVVEVGVNIQKGQELVINAPIEAAEFARLLTGCAYDRGAKKVYVDYVDEEITKITYLQAPEEAFEEYPKWLAEGKKELAGRNAAFISISGSNPDLLKDVDPERIATYQKVAGKALDAYRKYIQNSDVTWCVVSIPTKGWSEKVFPNLKGEEAVNALWEKIFIATRINEVDPVGAWKAHTDDLAKRCKFLDEKKIKELHYVGPGTDLKVELPKGHIWCGGGEDSTKGIYFVANMPTEEAFTMPAKYGVNGKLSSTKPLSYGGNLIDEFTLEFEKGKIVNFEAKQGYEILKKLIETDEGSHYLGEVAIVPHNSPVSNTNTIFYNTLFDENASCHFAIGSSYPINIEGGATMDDAALEAKGANTSITHVDFMVGGPQLAITATTETGEQFDVLKDGEWAF